MHALLEQLAGFDRMVTEAVGDVRWAPLTAVFVLASAWWVKGLVFLAAGAVRDARRRLAPVTALVVLVAFGLAAAASAGLKLAVGRARPPVEDPAFEALVALPSTASFPSGHATTAFAAAVALGVLVPRLRAAALALAALIAVSRVYLGVHFVLDVLAGALLGSLVGAGVALAARQRLSR